MGKRSKDSNGDTDQTRRIVSIGRISRRLGHYCTATIVISQILVIVIAAVIYTYLDGLNNSYAFFITMSTIAVTETLTLFAVRELFSYPLDIIARSISSIIGEKPSIYPPNPNRLRGPVKEELIKTVDFLYSKDAPLLTTAETKPDEAGQVALNLLHSLPVGIIALDYNFNVLAFNDNAPVYRSGNRYAIQLDFRNSNQPLGKWFNAVRDEAISASQTWTRIQNVPSGSLEPRHVYDVVATYHQHAQDGVNLIIVTIDRTADYVDSEDNIDFVALAAHELRGPLTIIRGYLDMLDEEIYSTATREQQALLDRLNVSARQLVSYVNNVLNANRYDRNHLQLKLAEMRAGDIVRDVQDDLNLRASTKNRHIDWQIPDNLPTVAADKSSVGEVITNLVDNAIKYSNPGGNIEVTAKRSGDFVQISVTDHGIGIPRSATEHLFTKFYRSHRSSASIGGTGIGLYISRAIVESHGGTISVDSVEGEGSTFTFTLPVYSTVMDKLDNDSNSKIINRKEAYISNHGTITK